MIDKTVASISEALKDVADGATILVGGFGTAGQPTELIEALLDHGARELTVVSNNAGSGDEGLALLLAQGRVRKIICSFPRQADSWHFDRLYRAGRIELELIPQGNLAERLRAAGAGIGGFFTPTGYGTELAKGKAARNFGPVMAMAARTTVASVHELVELGSLDPESVVTPGIHVNRVVCIPRSQTRPGGFKTTNREDRQ